MEILKNSEDCITVNGHDYIAIENENCCGCAFHHDDVCTTMFLDKRIYCGKNRRSDHRSIIWISVHSKKQCTIVKLYNKQKPNYSLKFKIK